MKGISQSINYKIQFCSISYCLGLVGPSFAVDTACSSGIFALDSAFMALRSGQCENALVCGTNILLHPFTSISLYKLGVLSKDGHCRIFDEKASGYVRSESICALFLQKTRNAKRIYAKVVHSNVNCDGYVRPPQLERDQVVTFPELTTRMNNLRIICCEIIFEILRCQTYFCWTLH